MSVRNLNSHSLCPPEALRCTAGGSRGRAYVTAEQAAPAGSAIAESLDLAVGIRVGVGQPRLRVTESCGEPCDGAYFLGGLYETLVQVRQLAIAVYRPILVLTL